MNSICESSQRKLLEFRIHTFTGLGREGYNMNNIFNKFYIETQLESDTMKNL